MDVCLQAYCRLLSPPLQFRAVDTKPFRAVGLERASQRGTHLMRYRLWQRLLLALLATLVIPLHAVEAHEPEHHGDEKPLILKAEADYNLRQLSIFGLRFAAAKPPVVVLGGVKLKIVSVTGLQIVALLPPNIGPASYRLEVHRGGTVRSYPFEATIGAVGPKGPQGPQGLPGPAGPVGPQGPRGD